MSSNREKLGGEKRRGRPVNPLPNYELRKKLRQRNFNKPHAVSRAAVSMIYIFFSSFEFLNSCQSQILKSQKSNFNV